MSETKTTGKIVTNGGSSLLGGMCGDLLNQFLTLLMENENMDEVKKRLIDPLIDYYKNKLFIFYGIITFLLILVIFSNFYIIYRLHR